MARIAIGRVFTVTLPKKKEHMGIPEEDVCRFLLYNSNSVPRDEQTNMWVLMQFTTVHVFSML